MALPTIMLTQDGARELVEQINDHLHQAGVHLGMARSKLWHLKEQRGWEALNYPSWRACVQEEFQQKQSQLYRQLKAAETELALGANVGDIPERVLRPLSPFTPEDRKVLYEAAQILRGPGGKVTSGDTQLIAEMAQEWRTTGAFSDGDGEQFALGEKLAVDLTGRMVESMQRQRSYMQESANRNYVVKGGTGTVLMCAAKSNGKFRVVIEVECDTCLNGGQEYKVHVWE